MGLLFNKKYKEGELQWYQFDLDLITKLNK